MTYNETLNYIHSLGKFRLPATLDRIKKVCESFGNPQDKFKSIHIAGTNGKGSTATLISEIFKTEGFKTGLYISPFVVDFRERIQINGKYISENDLVKHAKSVMNTGIELNEFEFITAVCFLYFKEQNVDIAVIEAGLGGRLDATNVIKNPLASVITKIGLDHTAILGDTVEEIAAEKCGIIKRGAPLVTVCNQDEKALEVIKKNAERLIIPDIPQVLKGDFSGNEFIYKDKKYFVSLLGVHQCFNAVTAFEAVKATGIKVKEESIKTAFKNVSFPARLEVVSNEPLTVIDGAHNADGARALAEFLKKDNKNPTMVIAMMRDKNCDAFLQTVLPFAGKCIVTEIENPRCMKADELLEKAGKYFNGAIKTNDLKSALKHANSFKNPIFIAGSLYLASEAREYYKNNEKI